MRSPKEHASVLLAPILSLTLGSVLPYQLFVCVSIGLIFALLAWLLWFG